MADQPLITQNNATFRHADMVKRLAEWRKETKGTLNLVNVVVGVGYFTLPGKVTVWDVWPAHPICQGCYTFFLVLPKPL